MADQSNSGAPDTNLPSQAEGGRDEGTSSTPRPDTPSQAEGSEETVDQALDEQKQG